MDIYRATDGQVWTIGEGQDKNNVKEDNNVVCGKRPALIIRSSGTNCTVIPFSTSERYSALMDSVVVKDGVESYPAIDAVQTIPSYELGEYIGILKPATYKRILAAFVNYIYGDTQYSSKENKYINVNKAYSKPMNNYQPKQYVPKDQPVIDYNDEPEETVAETPDVKSIIKSATYNKYSIQDKVFIIFNSAEDVAKKFNVSISYATTMRYRYKNLVKNDCDLCKYSKKELDLILKSNYDDIKQWADISELSFSCLKYMITHGIENA